MKDYRFCKGGRKKGSINEFNSYLYNNMEFRTIKCLTNYIKCSRTTIYNMLESNIIILVK